MISKTLEGVQAWGTGKLSDPKDSGGGCCWLVAANRWRATARAGPKQRGCSLLGPAVLNALQWVGLHIGCYRNHAHYGQLVVPNRCMSEKKSSSMM